ncbi:hypothetical protein WM33_20350 [Burkholderia multivorans]|nr:hypothetical protein WM33_20350 [Burkholderia multivorans]KVZ75382.1 hypothetical protein WL23_23850 [Burkholderia multivorans]
MTYPLEKGKRFVRPIDGNEEVIMVVTGDNIAWNAGLRQMCGDHGEKAYRFETRMHGKRDETRFERIRQRMTFCVLQGDHRGQAFGFPEGALRR